MGRFTGAAGGGGVFFFPANGVLLRTCSVFGYCVAKESEPELEDAADAGTGISARAD